jgi:hypothetical protein
MWGRIEEIEVAGMAAESIAMLPDDSFRRLLGELAWRRLAAPIRERFARKPAPGAAICYRGAMQEARCSTVGYVFAQLCRLIGTPLAPHRGSDVPCTVTLRADARGGIVWERCYRFAAGRLITCRSVKRCVPAGRLIECVGGSVGMWLKLSERDGALHFHSTGYFWEAGAWRLPLPAWLTPGALHVMHADLGGGRFRFFIEIHHPLFGETFRQDGVFAAERM